GGVDTYDTRTVHLDPAGAQSPSAPEPAERPPAASTAGLGSAAPPRAPRKGQVMIVLRKNPQDRDAVGSTRRDLDRLDRSIFAAIAATPTPTLDQLLRRTSNSADRARLWLGIAAGPAVV